MQKNKILKHRYFRTMFWLWVLPQSIKLTSLYNLYSVSIDYINSVFDYLVLIMAVLYIIMYQKYSASDMVRIVLIGAISVVSAISCHNFSLVSLFVIIVSAADIEIESILKKYFKFGVVFIAITMLLSIIDVIPNETMARYNMTRYSMGFRHPNILGIEVAQFVIIYIYLHRKENIIKIIATSIISIMFLYLIPDSRTAYILIGIVLVIYMIISFADKKSIDTKLFFNIMIIGSVLFNIFSVYFGITNGRALLERIFGLPEQFTSFFARFTGGYDAYMRYGISLFGKEVILDVQESWGIGHIWLDNTYLTLLIRYGILMYVIFSFSYYYLMNIKKSKDKYLFIILFSYSVYGIMEPSMFIFVYNAFLLFFKDILFTRNKKDAGL